MRLHVVYRSHGGENSKDRPWWYSKQVALLSFCRSLEEARGDVDVVFLNDGEIDPERTDLMAHYGEIVQINGGSNRRSYLQGLRVPAQRKWPAGDLVLFAEDDYLWRPEALRALVAAAADDVAEYFAPYGSLNTGNSGPAVNWHPHLSTTSTFATYVDILRQDRRLLLLCCLSGGDFDHTSCLTLQGKARFGPIDIVRHHDAPQGASWLRRTARALHLTATRTAVDLRSLRRPSRRRRLVAAEPQMAAHMEVQLLGPGDWEELAQQTWAWDRARQHSSTV